MRRGMHVSDVMTAPAVTVEVSATWKDVTRLMLDRDIGALPVVDRGRLVGIVTDADLLAREAHGGHKRPWVRLVAEYFEGVDPKWLRKAEGVAADEVMTRTVTTARPSETVVVAARRMLDNAVKHLVVVDDRGQPVGVVSRRDLLRFFAPGDDEVAVAVHEALHDVRWVPEDAIVEAGVVSGIVTLTGSVHHPSDIKVVEAAVRAVPGVVDVLGRLAAREPEPAAR